jgi:hypothetical protein
MLLGSTKAAANIDVVSRLRRFMSSSLFSNTSRLQIGGLKEWAPRPPTGAAPIAGAAPATQIRRIRVSDPTRRSCSRWSKKDLLLDFDYVPP